MSLIIDAFRDIVEKGLELHSAHKLLHFASKIFFSISILPLTILIIRCVVHVASYMCWLLKLSCPYPDFLHPLSLSFLGLAFLVLAFSLSLLTKTRIAYNHLLNALPRSMDNLYELFSKVKHVDLYTFRKSFIDVVTDLLYEKMSKGLNTLKLLRLVAPLLLINVILLPLAMLCFIYVLYPHNSLTTSSPVHPLYAVIMLLPAFALSYVNVEVVVPSKLEREDRRNEVSGGSDKESGRIVKIARRGLMAIIGLSLLEARNTCKLLSIIKI